MANRRYTKEDINEVLAILDNNANIPNIFHRAVDQLVSDLHNAKETLEKIRTGYTFSGGKLREMTTDEMRREALETLEELE